MTLPELPFSPYLFSEWVSDTEKKHQTMYTADQMIAFQAATLESCAKVCDKYKFGQAPAMIQDAIRSMK